MTSAPPDVSVCVCTFRRPEMLGRLLDRLAEQDRGGAPTFEIVVVDNDAARSAEPVVAGFAARTGHLIEHRCEPRQNIALARNLAVEAATGGQIAFIDDDEFPEPGWLAALLQTLGQSGAAGVLGPVRPHFEQPPPAWILKGRFCERREHPTGTVMDWNDCRTGNLLFRRSILTPGVPPFDARFGTGGEDKDFFRRMTAAGHRFVWCNEAVVFESVPASRTTRSYLLHRALLRGRNSLHVGHRPLASLAKSAVAVPLYTAILPFALLAGHHRFMNRLVRLCDHLGKLLARFGLNPVGERRM